MSTDKPSQNEDEYFARQDAELIKKQRLEHQRAAIAVERKSHFMKCPKCGADLVTELIEKIPIDRCPECSGIWLDNGELEALGGAKNPGLVGRVFGDLFASRKKK